MHEINFNNGSVDVTANTIEGGLNLGGGNDNVVERFNAGETPILRNGIAKNGSCIVEVGDGSSNTATLAELQALHSPVGAGNYTVTIDSTIYAYLALIDIYVIGTGLQLIKISWKGTLESVDI